MHISKLTLVNYRNFSNTTLLFNKGTNTIIGENGSGKTNLFRAIRLLLDDNMIRSAYRLDEKDFNRSLKQWQGHWIIISLEFEDVSQDEAIQALFLHGVGNIEEEGPIGKASYNLIFRPNREIRMQLSELVEGDHDGMNSILESIRIDHYETVFTGKSDANFANVELYKNLVGDFENAIFSEEIDNPSIGIKIPAVLSIAKEISFTFIQALRDVISEFHNNRTNPLLTLLKSRSGEIDATILEPITNQVKGLNDSIEQLEDVQNIRADIVKTIKGAAGETYSPTSLSIKSELSDEADKLFQSLKLFVGESGEDYEGVIHELSLGGANLIYLTLKLLEFNYQVEKQSFANFLLIEEPEAHIHTHIQKTLFQKLDYINTQIIYSTHSTHISEVSHVENVNILGKTGNICEAYQPTSGLFEKQIKSIQRYLDAVRSNLLFAKSVILVEGDAEEILIPILVKKVFGVSLDELGISLINIRSTGFQNVAILFDETRIRKKCSIITDLDTSIIDTNIDEDDSDNLKEFKRKCKSSEEKGARRKVALDDFVDENSWVDVFYATHTFEVDLVREGCKREFIATLSEIYRRADTIEKAKRQLESHDIRIYGRRALMMAEQQGKGWFANLLGGKVRYDTCIPDYILDAIFFACPIINNRIWHDIFKYRFECINKEEAVAEETKASIKQLLGQFTRNEKSFEEMSSEFQDAFPDDLIVTIIERL